MSVTYLKTISCRMQTGGWDKIACGGMVAGSEWLVHEAYNNFWYLGGQVPPLYSKLSWAFKIIYYGKF